MKKEISCPNYENILKSYKEIVSIIGTERIVEKLKSIGGKYGLCLEVDGVPICWSKVGESIDWVRVDYYKELDCIYFFADGSIYFDIEEENGMLICDSVRIEEFTKEFYEQCVKEFLEN